jgi:hypothetical protein
MPAVRQLPAPIRPALGRRESVLRAVIGGNARRYAADGVHAVTKGAWAAGMQ